MGSQSATNDIPLYIPLAPLDDYFQCSICMCRLTVATVTQCGHRYCEKCIKEWVNRQHKCPCCNHALTLGQLIRDHQFDCLISIIEAEKDKAETRYFENIINSASSQDDESHNQTPVEEVLKKHLKNGLLGHEAYFQNLKKSYQTKMNVLETTTQQEVAELHTHGLSQDEIVLQTQSLMSTLDRQKADLNNEMEKCTKMVADAYDKFLENHIPRLDVLPVKVDIRIAKKNILLSDVTFQPTDCLKEVRDTVESLMIKKHNPVHTWDDDVKMFLFGPFAKCCECEMEKVILDYTMSGNLLSDVQLLNDNCMLGLQYGMKPGSVIVIHGSIKLESDLPKKCFVQVYKSVAEIPKVDYFSCKECNFKWICRSCMEVCHQGHEVSPYIMQHQPNCN
ncbi:hypothetical protein ACF0H5_013039 [Mactra antiquata]